MNRGALLSAMAFEVNLLIVAEDSSHLLCPSLSPSEIVDLHLMSLESARKIRGLAGPVSINHIKIRVGYSGLLNAIEPFGNLGAGRNSGLVLTGSKTKWLRVLVS